MSSLDGIQKMIEERRLKVLMPKVADELEQLLIADGLHDLAKQIDVIYVYDRCRCGDDFCASF